MKKAIFLDRDGTINVDTGYVHKIEDLQFLAGAKEWLQTMQEEWYSLVLVTNQSGIWRWYYTLDDAQKFNKELEKQSGVQFDAMFICPHNTKEECDCRKPLVSAAVRAFVEETKINLLESFMIWDKDADIEFWQNLGCKTVRITSGQYDNETQADYTVQSISEFIAILNKKTD